MSSKAGRVLALLEALQDHPSQTGPQLAARLGVDVRTVRRDVVALQDLGIPVDAERGPAGGYRLAPGYRMPPLMLTGAEATVVTLGLLAARRDGLDAEGPLAKLRRVLPDAVRRRVEALEQTLRFTAPTGASAAAPALDELAVLADAALRGRRVRARYTTATGETAQREVSPFAVVAHAGRWYVPGFDHARGEARALRADRFAGVRLGGPGVAPPPGFDAVAFVSRTLAQVPWQHEVEVVVHADRDAVAQRFPATLAELEPVADGTLVRLRADSLDWVAGLLAGAGHELTVRRPPELRDALHALADRLRRA